MVATGHISEVIGAALSGLFGIGAALINLVTGKGRFRREWTAREGAMNWLRRIGIVIAVITTIAALGNAFQAAEQADTALRRANRALDAINSLCSQLERRC